MNIINQLLTTYLSFLVIGLILLTLGILISIFKLYWLISGLNTASKKQLNMINIEYFCNYFGIFLSGLGFLILANPVISVFFRISNFGSFLMVIVSVVLFFMILFLFGKINKSKIYK